MSSEKTSENKVVYKIVYVGDDENYWNAVQSKYRTVVKVPVTFKKLFPKEGQKIQSLIVKISRMPVHVIYVDFTKNAEEAYQLARMLNRNNLTKQIVTVGLLDHQADEVTLKRAILSGVQFAHIKCSEFHDIVYDPMALVDQTVLAEPKYALAQASDNIIISELARINSVTIDQLSLEYNRPIVQGSEFSLQTGFLNVRMPSSIVKVTDVVETNFYYNFNHKFLLSYNYMDDDHYEVDESSPSKEEQLANVRRKYYKWLEDNMDRSKPKDQKVLIICKDLKLFNESLKGLDKYPFVIRHQPFLMKPDKEIKKALPDILAFQLERSRKDIMEEIAKKEAERVAKEEAEEIARADRAEKEAQISEKIATLLDSDDAADVAKAEEMKTAQEERLEEQKKIELEKEAKRLKEEEELKKASEGDDDVVKWQNPLLDQYQNDLEALNQIIQIAKTIPDYDPIIIVFKCLNHNSAKLQQMFKYPRIMAHQTDLSFDLVVNMATALQKKLESKPMPINKTKIGDKLVPDIKVTFNKLNPHSIAEIEFPIILLTMREHELTFSSAAPVAKNTVFKCRLPLPTEDDADGHMIFFITVVPHTDSTVQMAGNESYRGLIHGIGEEGRKELRQFINSVFFRAKEQQKRAELEEFKQKNEEFKQKKGGGKGKD